MAEIDTSSYPKAALPQQKSLLDQVGQFQQLESNRNTIDKQKLDLVNQRFGEMAKGFTGLIADKDLTEDKVRNYVENQVKLGYVPAQMAAQTISQLPPKATPDQLRQHLQLQLQHAQTTVEAINSHFGTPAEQSDGANTYAGVRKPAIQGGGFVAATATPNQLPPTSQSVDANATLPNGQPNPGYGQQGYVGPSGPAGPRPLSSLTAQPPVAPAARMAPAGPISGPAIQGPSANFGGNVVSAVAEQPTAPASVSSRIDAAFPQRVATSLPPGTAEAIGTVAASSGKDYAADLSRAKNFKQDLYPAQSALEGVKELGPQGMGPGTPALTDLKSAIITWLPNADKKTIDDVANFQQTRKYLTQIARSSGATGTNDQLAAAFEANPSITMSKAATENVLKSVIALRKMQHAQVLLAEKENVQPADYSKWIAKNQNTLDARAFGFDMMTDDAKKKLVTNLKKDPKAYKRFEDSLQFAHDADLIEPPARK